MTQATGCHYRCRSIGEALQHDCGGCWDDEDEVEEKTSDSYCDGCASKRRGCANDCEAY